MKIATVVGARPQFIKSTLISRTLQKENVEEIIIHTGQHFDYNMSDIFFDELKLGVPKYNLEIGSGTHANQTGRMMIEIEKLLLIEKPSAVIVYGDTNSTLAGAMAASKLNIPVIHIEAGLRAYNKMIPEEINRIIVDHISSLLFAVTELSYKILANEGLSNNSILSGDLMYDLFIESTNRLSEVEIINHVRSVFDGFGLDYPNDFVLVTMHRQQITSEPEKLYAILRSVNMINIPCIFPIHPRTRKILKDLIDEFDNIYFIDPLSYYSMLSMTKMSSYVLTDSGGLLREAFFLDKPAIILRGETEFPEILMESGYDIVFDNYEQISQIVNNRNTLNKIKNPAIFGNGIAHKIIAKEIIDFLIEN
jgi:UDP-GlcNAc3NAcA epimerase